MLNFDMSSPLAAMTGVMASAIEAQSPQGQLSLALGNQMLQNMQQMGTGNTVSNAQQASKYLEDVLDQVDARGLSRYSGIGGMQVRVALRTLGVAGVMTPDELKEALEVALKPQKPQQKQPQQQQQKPPRKRKQKPMPPPQGSSVNLPPPVAGP